MSIKNYYHELTKHSYYSVRSSINYIDWSKQPSAFKIYPENFPLTKLDIDKKIDRLIYLLGGVTAKKVYPSLTYYLRTIPSAGALYPVEIYFQARDVDGLKDGIYHFSVAESGIRLLYEIDKDEGVELYFEDKRKIEGFIFLYSTIYYRSSWKYKNRAFRYCLLDAGHALGALEVSSFLYNHAYFIRYKFDKLTLNEKFGFKDREFFLSSATVGRYKKEKVKRFNMHLPFIDGTKYFEKSEIIEKAYIDTLDLDSCKKNYRYPKLNFNKDRLYEAIINRRSMREFFQKSIKKEEFEFILDYMRDFIPNDCDEKINIYSVLNRVENLKSGLYIDGKLLIEGDFSQKSGYLCLEQSLAKDSAVTFFLTGASKNYQPLYQKAGIIGHRCYIASSYLQIGCSGIGAYYDDEVNEFLNSNDMVLYALAIGK